MRKSTLFLAATVGGSALLGLLLTGFPEWSDPARDQRLARRQTLVRELGLTDLCLFTEARYTRHVSQADLHAAFQDHPLAFDLFPSGSLVTPPTHLWGPQHAMD